MNKPTLTLFVLLAGSLTCLAVPLSAQARPAPSDIGDEISQELADARKKIQADLAEARKELKTENLRLDNSLRFGDGINSQSADLARAEITPDGNFLIDGKKQNIDADQRRQLLAYRKQVIAIALSGIEIGEQSAEAALAVVDSSWISLLFNAMTGRLESRIERDVMQQVQPAVLAICRQLPAVMASQQQLASSLPQFQPYATLEADDVADCEDEVRHEFASL